MREGRVVALVRQTKWLNRSGARKEESPLVERGHFVARVQDMQTLAVLSRLPTVNVATLCCGFFSRRRRPWKEPLSDSKRGLRLAVRGRLGWLRPGGLPQGRSVRRSETRARASTVAASSSAGSNEAQLLRCPHARLLAARAPESPEALVADAWKRDQRTRLRSRDDRLRHARAGPVQ
jgi:hypothetical protein